MLVLKIEFLTGRYIASEYNDRQAAEWPPHPARVFSALVAAWAEAADPPCRDERRALEWLETAGPPRISASPASYRTVMTNYVPVNDTRVRQSLQGYRDKTAIAQQKRDAAKMELDKAIASGDSNACKPFERTLQRADSSLEKAKAKQTLETAKRLAPLNKLNAAALKNAASMLPESRIRQARHFPSVTPSIPVVHLIWNHTMPDSEKDTLTDLVKRVARLGHSSSLVHITVKDCAPEPNWIPADDGREVLRVAGNGQLSALEAEWRQHRETEPRILPCSFQRYRDRGQPLDSISPQYSCFSDDWIVFRQTAGPKLPISRCADVASAFRGALLHWAEDPPDEVLSGHLPDGRPTKKPHTAFAPLPFVGHRHADGRILGVAVVLPREIMESEKKKIFRAIGHWESSRRVEDEEAPALELKLGRAGVLILERIPWGRPQQSTLRSSTWCRPSKRWLSVTPVALDRNPGNLYAKTHSRQTEAYSAAQKIIANACTRIGLPEPENVTVLPSATMPGTIKARQFPAFPSKPGSIQRTKVHAVIRFPEPIAGPVMIGAGRFFGLGLFRPAPDEE